MDLLKTVREIGFFETGRNVVDVLNSEDVRLKAGAVMPLPDETLVEDTEKVADWLARFGKSKYMFNSPEIALIEKIPLNSEKNEAIILVPCDMESEIRMRLKDNLPRNVNVTLLEEPYFPDAFVPSNGIIVVCGYMAGERLMVLPETYRMIEHYGGFLGKKLFVPYTQLNESTRYRDWIEVGADKFNAIWRRAL